MNLRALFSTFALALFISGDSLAQCQLTLQPDSLSSKDAHIFSLDCNSTYAQQGGGCTTTNFAGAWWARASAWTYGGAPGNYRTFIEFNLDSLQQAGCSVNSAIFTLSPDGSSITNSGNNAFNVLRVTQPWLESNITWDTQPTVAAVDSGIDYVTIPADATPFNSYDIDLTAMVNYWLANPGTNYGFMVSLVAEVYYSRVVIGLSENTDPTLRPKLLLDLNCPGACTNLLSGYIYDDANGDCSQDSSEAGLSNWLVKILPGPIYASTDATGYYEASVSNANYTVTQIIPNNHLWDSICPINPNSYSVTGLTGMDTVSNLDFALKADTYCPDLTVDIGANFLRECHNEVYRVSYCNNGNVAANNVYIEVDFDSKLVPSSSTVPWDLPQNGNVYTFQLGTLNPGACGVFAI
ncbi:MAG: DNRLRE domain-containing protein, partial [Flavobacteriales bacterium]|nr:DNRLRE domain-containing protein [Flavobacteriales bacterium]